MESISIVERAKGGAERTSGRLDEAEQESGGSPAELFYDGDSADDELSKVMSSLKMQFEAFDDDAGTLNFMGEMSVDKEESFCQNFDKENVVFDWNNVIRPPQRRRWSGQVTTSRPIDFNKLRIKTVETAPCSLRSLYKGIATVLKENVNRAGDESQIVDEFWSTEMERKISPISRRKLTGFKTPTQAKPKAVGDRNNRHARSRRGGTSRTLARRPNPSDPVAAYISSTYVEGDIRHRRISFLSSPFVKGIDTGGGLGVSGAIHAKVERHNCSSFHRKIRSRTSPRQDAIRIRTLEENALLTTSHDCAALNEHVEMPNVTEAEDHKCGGSRRGEQIESKGLLHNQEKSFVEGPVANENEAQLLPNELRGIGHCMATPPCVDAHQNSPPAKALIGNDGNPQKGVKRGTEKTRYDLEGCGSTWREGRRKSQRIRVKPLEWWRGEKLNYAIHDSLMTIVGVCRP